MLCVLSLIFRESRKVCLNTNLLYINILLILYRKDMAKGESIDTYN